jgi:cytochrome c553
MKKSFFSIICLMAALTANQAIASGDAAAGESKVAVCAGCHGSDGNSMVASVPKLAGLGENYLVRQLRYIQSGERAIVEMTGLLDASSDQDLQDMAAFYNAKQRQVSGAKEITLIGYSDPDEVMELGENIYRGGNLKTEVAACIGCHSPAGNGNDPAGYPGLGGQHADYIESQLLKYRSGERASGANAKIMQGVAERLSNKEIKAVANYISGLN